MGRASTKLSLIIIQIQTDDDEEKYILQYSRHLNGYNFFEGHIQTNEQPRETAIRTLKEATGFREIKQRWGIEFADEITPKEWQKVDGSLKVIAGSYEDGFKLPFFSTQATKNDENLEKVAHLFLFHLTVDRDKHPKLYEILVTTSKITLPDKESYRETSLSRIFTATELLKEAWKNSDNPFLRFAFKKEILKIPHNQIVTLPHIFNITAFETFLEDRFGHLFRDVLNIKTGESLDFKLLPPKEEEARVCLLTNRTLRATLEIRWSGSEEVLRFSFPYPALGVFILRSDTSKDGRGGRWIWHPRLTGKPGLWMLRHHSFRTGGRHISKLLRINWLCQKYWEIPLPDSAKEDTSLGESHIFRYGKFISSSVLGKTSDEHDASFFREIEQQFPSMLLSVTKKNRKEISGKLTLSLLKALEKLSKDENIDEQDIRCQRLYTYSAYLVELILEKIICFFDAFIRKVNNQEKNTWALAFWLSFFNFVHARETSHDLVPVSDLMKSGWLHYFDPLNGIDALSKLTSFQRYNFKKETIERLPGVYRQNHHSFRGIVCPVETPESLKVGVSLHLARGVRTDVLGNFYTQDNTEKDHDLGYAASLVPFYQHNDGIRSMMGAKNLKQAVPIKGHSAPAVATGHEQKIREFVRTLSESGIAEDCSSLAPGIDLLVAYMPWYGWNMEDAIVANSGLVEESVLDWKTEKDYFQYILPGLELTKPVFENTFEDAFKVLLYDDKGLRKPGQITPQSPVAFFRDPKTGQILRLNCGGDDPGELLAIEYSESSSHLLGGSLSWTVRRRYPLEVGDKLMGRYGNKGVVSSILPPDKMPRLPNDERMPAQLRGRSVDLVFNPHGVISRMNLGQLLETSIGLLNRLNYNLFKIPGDIGRAFSKVDLNRLRQSFISVNGEHGKPLIDEYGRMHLELPGGKKTKAPVTVGFQYIVRLKHVAARKAQVRGGAKSHNPYPYNAITGQPVGGRRRKGGQRLGEMEIWALAAHQADKSLQSIFGCKSDPAVFGKALPHGQTFQAIKDHLFSLGVEIKEDDKGARLEWASQAIIEQRGREVARGSTWAIGVEGTFYCAKENCRYQFTRPLLATGKPERGEDFQLTVGDVLGANGLRFPDNIKEAISPVRGEVAKGKIKITLEPTGLKKKKKHLTFNFTRRRRSIHIGFKLGKKNFSAYKQDDKKEKEIPFQQVADFWLTCPNHTTKRLVSRSQRLVPVAVKGGLCDQELFGNADISFVDTDTWGYIRLPGPLEYPGRAPDDRKKLKLRRLRFGKNDEPPALESISVLPLKYRYRGPERSGMMILPQEEQLTSQYKELAELVSQGSPHEKIRSVVAGLFEMLLGRLLGKYGLLRRNGLGRRVDMSGRLVIVPDPNLHWDVCGVPTEILITLLGPQIIKQPDMLLEFIQDESVDRLIEAIFDIDSRMPNVTKEAEQFVLSEEFWSVPVWPSNKITKEHLRLAQRVIERYLEEHPSTTVLLNRQPSLHRYSIMGFRPVPLKPEDGLVLRINPLVCKGFGADFDGDEMSIHMPIREEEFAEADTMKPTQSWNLFSLANQQPLANFDQDFVAGHFYISLEDQAQNELKTILAPLKCTKCTSIIEKPAPWSKGHGETLLYHICKEHPAEAAIVVPKWMRLAFKTATEHGLSFGFLELVHLKERFGQITAAFLTEVNNISDIKQLSEATNSLGEHILKELRAVTSLSSDHPGFGIAALAVSGARGTKQTRQLVSSRGYLDPGATGFECSLFDFLTRDSLVDGMTPHSSFLAAMNSRSSMIDKKLGTGRAGYLTRQLVLSGWNWVIKEGSCGVGSDFKSRLTKCLWRDEKVICASCYGPISGYDLLLKGFPAGLIAAQSFGERGTQLSMQSFHTAEKQLSIDEVVSLLNGKDPIFNPDSGNEEAGYNWFSNGNDAEAFVERIRREKGYRNIDERHLLLIWLIIHMSDKKTLASAWECNRSALPALVGPGQWEALLSAIRYKWTDDLSSQLVKVMTSRSPVDA